MTERTTPYSADEKRVSDYLQEITNGLIGSGDDPIGFILAAHASLIADRNLLRTKLTKANEEASDDCGDLWMHRALSAEARLRRAVECHEGALAVTVRETTNRVQRQSMDVLAAAIRKFAPDIAGDITRRWQQAVNAGDNFADFLRDYKPPDSPNE